MINGNDEIRGIIANFKKLATKIQQGNDQVKKTLKERWHWMFVKKNIKAFTMNMKPWKRSISSSNKNYSNNQNSKNLQTFGIMLPLRSIGSRNQGNVIM